MKEEINCFRELIHKELESDKLDYGKLLKMSQELDKLIVEYHRGNDEES